MPNSALAEALTSSRQEGLSQRTLDELSAIASDRSLSAIVRASAVREIGDQADPATAAALAQLLSDDSDLIRAAAVRLWRSTPAAARVARLQSLLSDPVATVRVATALELSNVVPDELSVKRRDALAAALTELKASMAAKSDFPEGQMAIGGLAMATRNWEAAQSAFAEATFMDPQLVQAWLARARIAAALGDVGEATAILDDARAKNPSELGIKTQLAQLLMSQGRTYQAIPVLKDVVLADPANHRMRITLALALLRTGDLATAGSEISVLRLATPETAEVLLLLALWQGASGNREGARETVSEITRRYPSLRLPTELDALSP